MRVTCITLVLCLFGTTGCVGGLIYSHTTIPLDTDLHRTPVHGGGRVESWKTLVIPLFYVDGQIEFDWGDVSIAKAMEEAGVETVHYADLETRRILWVWTQRWVHVYGE